KALVAAAAIAVAGVMAGTAFAVAPLTDAGPANTKAPGITLPDKLSPQLTEITSAQGSTALENGDALTKYYGYYDDGPFIPALGSNVEASKSEPDKNVYLRLTGQHGADSAYDYGTHFLYQGHELSKGGNSYVTRINLDADAGHRVTKLTETMDGGTPLPGIDG